LDGPGIDDTIWFSMTPRPRPLCATFVLALAFLPTACGATPSDASTSSPPGTATSGDAGGSASAHAKAATTHGQGTDFAPQASSLYRAAACGESGPLPKGLSPEVLAAHCALLAKDYAEYRAKWLDRAVPYLAGIVPPGLPRAVVYPFGGGDLVTALATFPDADEFTTISLEPAGDVRQVDDIPPGEWSHALAASRATLQGLLSKAYNTSRNLRIARLPLPEEIVHTMAALVLFGYEPVALRYFAIEPDGSLRYLDPDAKGELATSNMELVFRKAGDPTARPKMLRHIAANLGDNHLRRDPRVRKHLEAKGPVVAMTKAAIHLLASDDFSLLRNYLLAHMEWMISDDTGILPRHARAAGFVQEGHGVFVGPSRFGHLSPADVADLRKLFAKPEPLPFFAYGYPDASGKGDLIVTRKQR
jgi:hypothetical protein